MHVNIRCDTLTRRKLQVGAAKRGIETGPTGFWVVVILNLIKIKRLLYIIYLSSPSSTSEIIAGLGVVLTRNSAYMPK